MEKHKYDFGIDIEPKYFDVEMFYFSKISASI